MKVISHQVNDLTRITLPDGRTIKVMLTKVREWREHNLVQIGFTAPRDCRIEFVPRPVAGEKGGQYVG